mgnify:CR=1 FL=1
MSTNTPTGERYRATGKRKTSVARVILTPGTGQVTCNGRELDEFFGRNKLVAEIDTEEMRRFARHVVASGRSFSTADRKLAALSKMMRFALEKGVIPKTHKVPMYRNDNERMRFLTKEEAQKLLKLWRDWHQPEAHAFTVFALHTGARSRWGGRSTCRSCAAPRARASRSMRRHCAKRSTCWKARSTRSKAARPPSVLYTLRG